MEKICLFIFFLVCMPFFLGLRVYGSVHWDKNRAIIETDVMTVQFCSRRPFYIIWHNEEPNVKYIVELRQLIEYLDINNNEILDDIDTICARSSFGSKVWEFHYNKTIIDNTSVTILKLQSKIPVRYERQGGKPKEVEIVISNYISEGAVHIDNNSLLGPCEIGIEILVMGWPWRYNNSRLQLEILFGVMNMSHKVRRIKEGKNKYNIEFSGASSSYMYLNITKNIVVDDVQKYSKITVTENSIEIDSPHFISNLTAELKGGIVLPTSAIEFEQKDYEMVTGMVVTSTIISICGAIYSRRKIDRILKVLGE